MAASILNRMTGVGLYAGLLIAIAAVAALASGANAYAGFRAIAAAWPGRIVLVGISFSAFFHLFAGLRHLAWDGGKGFRPASANRTAWAAIAFAALATLAVWAYGLSGAIGDGLSR